MNRKFNFNPGPSTLPLPALEKARDALIDYQGLGYGILEMSHRHKAFDDIINGTQALLRKLFSIPEDYTVLFVGGGASTQFFHIPYNLLGQGKTASYFDTGKWAGNAIKEGKKFGNVHIAASTKADRYNRLPKTEEFDIDPASAYVHLTSNNTIFGTQWADYPDTGDIPLICDMSSDILCRQVDVSKFGMIYAGAQKNLGPAGITVLIVRQDLIDACPDTVPTMVNYQTHAKKNSLFNTPATFPIFVVKLVLEWLEEKGGLDAMQAENEEKARLLYGLWDDNPDFFHPTVSEKADRSMMNATLRLPSEDLEKAFLAQADEAGFVGLKGHRDVGGIRVSMYNALALEGVQKLCEFMSDFAKKNG